MPDSIILKLIMFVLAAPVGTVAMCKLLSIIQTPTQAEMEAVQLAKRELEQEAMTAAVQREALRQEERSELAA